ncbi:hypothetical protein [Coleofasciculus sp. H7-2]|uniref:hypothetical protein n=1 Tax=Coleofasciculus sp. H7-2 TaxID=3351545 RepID=UPI00366AEF34
MSQNKEIYLLNEATLDTLTSYWRRKCLQEEDVNKYGFLVSMRDSFKMASECPQGTPYRDKWFWMLYEFMQDEYNKMTVAQFNLDVKQSPTHLSQDLTRQTSPSTSLLGRNDCNSKL